jgi:hypothetical protein
MPYDTAVFTGIRGCASHSEFQNQREKVLDGKLASRYKAILVHCMDTIEDIRRKYEIAPKTCINCSAYDLCEELRQSKEEQG